MIESVATEKDDEKSEWPVGEGEDSVMVELKDLCKKASSNIAQKDLDGHTGEFPIYGASGLIGYVDFYKQEKPYIAVVKDGAGIGRVMSLPAKSSVIGTMQYILPNDDVDAQYLSFAMENMNLAKYFSGATIPHIYFKDYCTEKLPKHSEKEQKQISAVLSKVTELISLRKQQLAKLDELVKARFVEMFGDPVYNEMHWETKRLIDICRTIVDCPHSTPHYTTKDTGYKCIRTSAVKKNKILWEKVECISKQEYEERIKRKRPEKGDVIYTREGAILGIAAVIDRDYNVALGQRSMLLSPDIYKCTPCFLSMAMNFDSFLGKALGGVSGSASPHINVGDIKALEIIAPPIEIQNQFSTFVEQVDQQKQTVQESLKKLELLKKALMQEYFG